MPKISLCDRCQFYSNSPHLVCAVHPDGVDNHCLDYRLHPDYIPEEQWCPDGYIYYDGKLIKLPDNIPTPERQLWLLDNHPAFTGQCANCGYQYPSQRQITWDCPKCGTNYD